MSTEPEVSADEMVARLEELADKEAKLNDRIVMFDYRKALLDQKRDGLAGTSINYSRQLPRDRHPGQPPRNRHMRYMPSNCLLIK